MDETLSSRKRKDKPEEEEGTAEQIQNLKDRLHKSELLRKSMNDELTVLKGKISEMDVLMNLLKRPSDNSFDLSVLKPIDTKDITKPEPFDGDAKKFLAWFAGIKDLLTNRNQGWKLILDHIEAMKNTKCHDPDTQLFQSIGGEVAVQAEAYKAQLATYIRSYTKGDLHERVVKSQPDEVVDIVRELIYKYKHHNSFKILDLKSAIMAPPRASTPQDVEKILSDWKHQIHTVQLHDKNFQVPDDLKVTLLHRIMPKSFQEIMRARQERMEDMGRPYSQDYHRFEQDLFDAMEIRRMDEENSKTKGVHGLASAEKTCDAPARV